jgi:DNA-directed RNA polymerase specialized sigma subunit
VPRPPRPKPPGVTRRLEKFMRDYHKREQELDRQKAELREERDQAIRDAYQAGLLMQDIGKVVGLTHQRVSNIIRRKP